MSDTSNYQPYFENMSKVLDASASLLRRYDAHRLLDATEVARTFASVKLGIGSETAYTEDLLAASAQRLIEANYISKQVWERIQAPSIPPLATHSIDSHSDLLIETLADEANSVGALGIAIAFWIGKAVHIGTSPGAMEKAKTFWEKALSGLTEVSSESFETGLIALFCADAQLNSADDRIETLSAAINGLREMGNKPELYSQQQLGLFISAKMKRGLALQESPGHGPDTALRDLNAALDFVKLCEARVGQFSPQGRHQIAAIFVNRANIKQRLPAYGPESALNDYQHAIDLREALTNEMGDDFPDDWRARHAFAFLNRANAKSLILRISVDEASKDYSHAITQLRHVLSKPEASQHDAWRNALAMAHMNRSNALGKASEPMIEEAIEDMDEAIKIMAEIASKLGKRCPDDFLNNLAAAHLNRTQLLRKAPEPDEDRIEQDFDTAIETFDRLLDRRKDRSPPAWRHHLASSFTNRAVYKRAKSERGCFDALEDYDAALKLWRSDEIALTLSGHLYLATQVGAAVCRIECARVIADGRPLKEVDDAAPMLHEALSMLKHAAEERRRLIALAPSRNDQKAHIQGGRGIATFGAWLMAQLGNPIDALSFLEKQRSILLQETLLNDPDLLKARFGAEAATAVKVLQDEIRSLRLKEINPRYRDLDTAERDRLASAVRELWRHQENATTGSSISEVSLSDLQSLGPKHGAVILPLTTRFGTLVFIVRKNHAVELFSLGSLTTDDTYRWAETLAAADDRLTSDQTVMDEATLQFEETLCEESHAYWTDLIGPLTAFLKSELQMTDTAPLVFVTQGALDALPLHAAWRNVNGSRRHLIEDRTVSFAPGLTALSLLAKRRQHSTPRQPSCLAIFAAPEWKGMRSAERLDASSDIEWPAINKLGWTEIIGPFIGNSARASELLTILEGRRMLPPITDLVLSTHAVFEPKAPERSGLVLASDKGEKQIVSVADLLALNTPHAIDHVAMPACQSGQSGLAATPEESIGLVGAMIEAGVAAVTACLFIVSDTQAAYWMPAILEKRMNGPLNIADGLRACVIERQSGGNSDLNLKEKHRLTLAQNNAKGRSAPATVSGNSSDSLPIRHWAAFKPICAIP